MASLGQYVQETRAELRKVVWPTRQNAMNLTLVVIMVTIAMTVIAVERGLGVQRDPEVCREQLHGVVLPA